MTVIVQIPTAITESRYTMGVLLPNFRRRVQTTIGERTQSSLETVAAIKGGVLLSIKDGHEKGSRLDGSKYVVANVQVAPGRVIHIAGYGEDQVNAIKAMKVQDAFSAVLRPSARNWFKLDSFLPTEEQSAPAAE